MHGKFVILTLALFATLVLGGCTVFFLEQEKDERAFGKVVRFEATAYCPCGECCSWKLDKNGKPVLSEGKGKGKPKAVGITASGKPARPGTVAADTRYYPMGTVLYIPGYGYGVVEDRGGDIKGSHRLDLYFTTHHAARIWGRKKVEVIVFPPGTPAIAKNAPSPRAR